MAPETIISQPGILKLYDSSGRNFNFVASEKPTCPNDWFAQRYPDEVQIYGSPFIELTHAINNFTVQILPVSINIDCFAGILGGRRDLGHHIIYLESEMQWYFREVDGVYHPTTPEKLANLLRALMIGCAQDMPANVHKLNLFHEFRSDKVAKAIVHRAKSILSASESFFGTDSKHERIKGQEIHERIVRRLVQEMLEPAEGQVLLFNDVYAAFTEMTKKRKLEPLKRSQFRAMVMPIVRESFDLGLRNDLAVNDRQAVGWKNVRLIDLPSPDLA